MSKIMRTFFRREWFSPAHFPVERQARIVLRLAWGVLVLSLLGTITTWFLAGDRRDGMQLIITGGVLIIISIIVLFCLRQKKVIVATIILIVTLYIGTTIMLVPYGILGSDVILFGYFLPLILLSEFWRFVGVIISFVLTSISLSLVHLLEMFRLAGWATRSDILAVKLGFMFATMIIVAQVVMRSQYEIEVAQELAIANGRLNIAQKQLHHFTAGIAHDLGGPLQTLYAQFAGLDSVQKRVALEQLALIRAFIDQTRDFLDAQRSSTSHLRHHPLGLLPLAANALSAASTTYQVIYKGIIFHLDCPETLPQPYVLGDPTALRRVLDNLLRNALSVAPAHSTITISIREPADVSGSKQYIELAVTDQGPGITQADQQHIFEPYWSAPSGAMRVSTGWGLGLAIVAQLTAAMGGTYGVISSHGAGSTFWIRLEQCEPSS